MKFGMWLLLLILFVAGFASVSSAQSVTTVCENGNCVTVDASNQTGAYEYAVNLNRGRVFRHDPAFRGAEVIFRSSGQATEAEAKQYWMNSPGHRRLLLSGAIQEVACVGGVCVGRGIQGTANVAEPFMQATRRVFNDRTPLKKLRCFVRGCR